MGFAHLLSTGAAIATFWARFNIPQNVNIEFCSKGNIENNRLPRVVFFPLMAILEGWLDFPKTLYCIEPSVFMGLVPTNVFLGLFMDIPASIKPV